MFGVRNIRQKSAQWHEKGKSIRNPFPFELSGKIMGGKKKLSLKQMERTQARQEKGESKKSGESKEKKSIGIFPPDPTNKKVIDELKKMKVLTPYGVASRLDLRLSAAKHFLKELERRGTVEYISGSKNLKIYKIAD